MSHEVRGVLLSDLDAIASDLRPADRAEMMAAHGDLPAIDIISASVGMSWDARTLVIDGSPAAVFGCAGRPDGIGVPWALGTPACDRAGRAMIVEGRRYATKWVSAHRGLANIVHAENRRSIAWLKRVGFSIGEPLTIRGAPFLTFRR